MKALVGLLLAVGLGPAAAGALQDCADSERKVRCLERAKDLATEQMLERFLEAREKLATLGGRRGEQAAEALKQSQRAFERYVSEHCHGLAGLVAEGAAAALACETDLLRQRASTLEAIEPGTVRL